MHIVYISCLTFLAALVHAQTPGSPNSNVCRRTSTVFLSLRQVYENRGLYVTTVPDGVFFRLLDNLCVTAFPIAGSEGLYTFYSNVVLTNGTAITTYLLAKDVPPGTFRRANPAGTISQRFFSYFGDTTMALACTEFEFGVNPSPPLFAVSFSPNANSAESVDEMEELFRSRGFQNVSLYALPMKLPTQCVLNQPCEIPQRSECDGDNGFYYSEIHRPLGLC